MLNLIYPPRHYFFDSGGKPLIGGYIEYDGLIYQDVFKTVPHQKRIWLDENGSALLYIDDDCELHLYNRHGDFIETKTIPAQHEWVFFYDKFGQPLKYGKVWVYRFRSTILKDSFSVDDKSIINANPVLLDGDGKAKIYIDGAYRLKVYNADDVLMHDVDVYQLPSPIIIRHDYFLQSLKYPTFKRKELWLSSRHYPKFVEQNLVLSSLLYPAIDNEVLSLNINVLDGVLQSNIKDGMFDDSLNVSIVPLDGELKLAPQCDVVDSLLLGINIFDGLLLQAPEINEQDNLNVDISVFDGRLDKILINLDLPPEDKLALDIEIFDGELK